MFESDLLVNFILYLGQGWTFFMVLVTFWFWKNKGKSEEHNNRFEKYAKLTCLLLIFSMLFISSMRMNKPSIEVPLYLILPVPFLLMAVASLICKPYLGWLKWVFRRD